MEKGELFLYPLVFKRRILIVQFYGKVIHKGFSDLKDSYSYYFFPSSEPLPKSLEIETFIGMVRSPSQMAPKIYDDLWSKHIEFDDEEILGLIPFRGSNYERLQKNVNFVSKKRIRYWYEWSLLRKGSTWKSMAIYQSGMLHSRHLRTFFYFYLVWVFIKVVLKVLGKTITLFKDVFVFNVAYQEDLQKAKEEYTGHIQAMNDPYRYPSSRRELEAKLAEKKGALDLAEKKYTDQSKNFITLVISLLAIILTLFGSILTTSSKDAEISRLKAQIESQKAEK